MTILIKTHGIMWGVEREGEYKQGICMFKGRDY